MRIQVVFLGPIAARMKQFELQYPGRLSVRGLLELLSKRLPQVLLPDGRPRPGILVFINGRDHRVYEEGDPLGEEVLVEVIQVFHGG